ncbi:MAG: ribonuclease III [Xanthomonadaceae bacterium]|nr:ribonuclease III [Xanthomonadaceae bacterium]
MKELPTLQETINYHFSNPEILEHALSHLSFCNEQENLTQESSYERLEFLGDAVLEFLISEVLFLAFPDEREGGLTRLRTAWVNETQLSRMARLINLGNYIRLGRGESRQGGCQKDSILADVYEALVAAIFLDGGIDEARKFIVSQFVGLPYGMPDNNGDIQDYKSHLQEQLQQDNYPLPNYRLIDTEGPDHKRIFQVEVASGAMAMGIGKGSSKKKAEQLAAREALAFLGSLDHDR